MSLLTDSSRTHLGAARCTGQFSRDAVKSTFFPNKRSRVQFHFIHFSFQNLAVHVKKTSSNFKPHEDRESQETTVLHSKRRPDGQSGSFFLLFAKCCGGESSRDLENGRKRQKIYLLKRRADSRAAWSRFTDSHFRFSVNL